MVCAIGIDVGATKGAVALVDSATGRVEGSESFSTSLEARNLPLLDAEPGGQAGVVGAASIASDRVQVGAL